jgi:hypothetical protein
MNKLQWLSVWGFGIGAPASPYGSAQTKVAPPNDDMLRTSPDAGDRSAGNAGQDRSRMTAG